MRRVRAACHDLLVVRLPCGPGLLLFACACGESGAATPPREPPGGEIAVAPAVTRDDASPGRDHANSADDDEGGTPVAVLASTPAPSAPVGHLVGPQHLARLFGTLASLEDGHRHDDVHVLQFGDSHTASDLGVGAFRRVLQARFGDGGRGFVPLGRPWKTFAAEGVKAGMDSDYSAAKVKFRGGSFTGTGGCYGLLGVGVETATSGARAWSEVAAPASRVELEYGVQAQGGSFDVFIDGTKTGRIATRASEAGGGFFGFDVSDGPHRVEARAVGDGDVVIFGLNLERPAAGVVVDTLGINGAQIFTPLRWGEECFAEQLRHASPELVVLAYGTNEAVEPGLTDATYEKALVDMLGRVARAQPTSACLLLGPPDLARRTKGTTDWKTSPRLVEIVAAQRRVAEAAGCAFYDQLEAMGGPGSMAQWSAEAQPRGSRDHIHLLRSGYAQLGTSFAGDLVRAYEEWRAAMGLPPVHH